MEPKFSVRIEGQRLPLELQELVIPLENLLTTINRYVLCLECDSAYFKMTNEDCECWNCGTKYSMFDDNGETGGVLANINGESEPTVIVSESGDGALSRHYCEQLDIDYDSFLHFWDL